MVFYFSTLVSCKIQVLMSFEADLIPTEKRLFLRFWQSTTGFWRTPRAWALLIFLISIILLQLLVYYRLNFWNRDFFNAVERKDDDDHRAPTDEGHRGEQAHRS